MPCYGGWKADDLTSFDVDCIDFSIHFFDSGRLACALLPVCTAEGDYDKLADTELGRELTIVVTTSAVRSNPSTHLVETTLASLDVFGDLSGCRRLVMCDGFKLRPRSQPKIGVITDEEAGRYQDYVGRVARLCRERPAYTRTRVVRLARRQGSSFAIREAMATHVTTPYAVRVSNL